MSHGNMEEKKLGRLLSLWRKYAQHQTTHFDPKWFSSNNKYSSHASYGARCLVGTRETRMNPTCPALGELSVTRQADRDNEGC